MMEKKRKKKKKEILLKNLFRIVDKFEISMHFYC